jgi:hypothetical protein
MLGCATSHRASFATSGGTQVSRWWTNLCQHCVGGVLHWKASNSWWSWTSRKGLPQYLVAPLFRRSCQSCPLTPSCPVSTTQLSHGTTMLTHLSFLTAAVAPMPHTVCPGNPIHFSEPAQFSCGAQSLPGVRCNGTCATGQPSPLTGGPKADCDADGVWRPSGACTAELRK